MRHVSHNIGMTLCFLLWRIQVTKVSPTAANAKIVCCGAQALEADFTGVIRQQDVRTHEIDKVGASVAAERGLR
jgi:hypothetical protein